MGRDETFLCAMRLLVGQKVSFVDDESFWKIVNQHHDVLDTGSKRRAKVKRAATAGATIRVKKVAERDQTCLVGSQGIATWVPWRVILGQQSHVYLRARSGTGGGIAEQRPTKVANTGCSVQRKARQRQLSLQNDDKCARAGRKMALPRLPTYRGEHRK